MKDEIKVMEAYIKSRYKTKLNFSESLGMTRQNLNYHFREAAKNNNIFTDEFLKTLWLKKIDVIANFRANRPEKNIAMEANEPYGKAELLPVAAYTDIIKGKDKVISTLEKQMHENKKIEKEIAGLKTTAHSSQQKISDVLTRTLAVQEVLLEYLAAINKKSPQEIAASVRIKEHDLRKSGY